jgi:uncharacterized C2H2 Zn-finger protein
MNIERQFEDRRELDVVATKIQSCMLSTLCAILFRRRNLYTHHVANYHLRSTCNIAYLSNKNSILFSFGKTIYGQNS